MNRKVLLIEPNYSNFPHQKSFQLLENQGSIRHLFDILTTK